MRRIVVKEARPGMVAARNIVSGGGVVLLESGDTIACRHLAALHSNGIYDLWITDAGFEFFDELCASQPTAAQQRLADGMRKAFLSLSAAVERSQMKRFALAIEDLVRSLLRAAPGVPCFAALTEDDGLLTHSCDVAALSMLLGLKLEGYIVEQRRRLNCKRAREVMNLAMGALFHDVGELMLPAQQRESRLAAASDGEEHWKIHVDEGYAIVRGRLDPSAAAIVLQHHQRYDGKGFGSQQEATGMHKVLQGQDIHIFARIVMAADLFCQTHFGTSGNIPQPMVKTLWQLQQSPRQEAMDPIVLECMRGLFPPFAEGMIVALSNQQQALVMRADPAYPCYPVVQALRQEHGMGDQEAAREQLLDLAAGDVMIEAVDGFPVEPFLFGTRKGRPIAA